MALIGQPSWHGLEDVMPANAPMSEWKKTAGLMHRVGKVPVEYRANGMSKSSKDKFVLYRDDTLVDLAIVGPDYKVVQPGEIIDFFHDLVQKHGFIMETAGSLAGGRKVWALARTGNELQVGVERDIVKQYLLLATSYDKSIVTTGKHTATRVVCENTMSIALNSGEPASRVNHRSAFNAAQMKIDLGVMGDEFKQFGEMANRMHAYPVKKMSEAAKWYAELLTSRSKLTKEEVIEIMDQGSTVKTLLRVCRAAKGAEATVWGLVNGTTAYVDHMRGRTRESGLNSAWFGEGAILKEKAWEKAMESMT